jgi:hypothetical protein
MIIKDLGTLARLVEWYESTGYNWFVRRYIHKCRAGGGLDHHGKVATCFQPIADQC